MGHPLNYKYAELIFASRRKTKDFKAYKTDTHLTKADDGTLTFSYIQFEWQLDEATKRYKRAATPKVTPLASITPDNVMTLLAPETNNWPSVRHMTIRNRLHEITGFDIYSDTGHHRNKDMPIRITHRYYDGGWKHQEWCANTNDKTIPYQAGVQFKVHDGRLGKVDCLNPPADVKKVVKSDVVQRVKAETAVIRKLALVMLRVDFDEHISNKLARNWYAPPIPKLIKDIDYKNPMGDDALAVLGHGLRIAQRPDKIVYVDDERRTRTTDELTQMLRARVLDNGMKALRKHIYDTTGGYEKVEVS